MYPLNENQQGDFFMQKEDVNMYLGKEMGSFVGQRQEVQGMTESSRKSQVN